MYVNNMKLSLSQEEIAAKNFSQLRLNNLTFFISNTWLRSHANHSNFTYFSRWNRTIAFNSSNNNTATAAAAALTNHSVEEKESENKETASGTNVNKIAAINQFINKLVDLAAQKIAENTEQPSGNDKETPVETQITKLPDLVQPDFVSNGIDSVDKVETETNVVKPVTSSPTAIDVDQSVLEDVSSQPISISTSQEQSEPTTTSTVSTTTTTPQPIQSTVTTVKPTPPTIVVSNKDASYLRLSNRIKILEANMSLSSQYLEKLSQHYKKKMDEMQLAFNLTTTALLDTIRIADERDLKQNERILSVEKKLEKLNATMESLDSFLGDVKFQSDIIMWTIIIVMNFILLIEIIRCAKQSTRNHQKQQQKPVKVEEEQEEAAKKKINHPQLTISQIESIIEAKLKQLIEEEGEKSRKKETLLNQVKSIKFETLGPGVFNTNIYSSNLDSTNTKLANETELQQQQQQQIKEQNQQAAAAAMVSSTLAVVAAVSIAAATASCSTLSQSNDNELESYVE